MAAVPALREKTVQDLLLHPPVNYAILVKIQAEKGGRAVPDIIVVGKGPAGVSAALYTRRANLSTWILGNGSGALGKTDRIENYYGFPEPISGPELLERGLANAIRLGCEVREEEVVGIGWNGRYTVHTKDGSYEAAAVILATGAARSAPKIPGIQEFEGRGISYCAVCDAFFYRNRDVAVLGHGEYAVHEAMELAPVAASVTMLTDGREPAASVPEGIRVDTRPVREIAGDTAVQEVRFAQGDPLPCAGVFIAVGVASSVDLAKKLGAETEGSRIVVDREMATNLPGLFAAGDCTGGLLQIAKAVGEGAVAGTSAIRFVRAQKEESK